MFHMLSDEEIIMFYRNLFELVDTQKFLLLYLHTDKLKENIKIIQKERCDDVGNELWYQMMLECMTVGREMSQRPSFPRRLCPDNRTKERCSACAPVMPPVLRIGAGFFVRRRLFHTVHLLPV